MPSDRFDANAGFSVNNTTVIDAARNISAVGATLTTVTATTYRNLPVASAGVSGVASFQSSDFAVSATGQVSLAPIVEASARIYAYRGFR